MWGGLMICPYCRNDIKEFLTYDNFIINGQFRDICLPFSQIEFYKCPVCEKITIQLYDPITTLTTLDKLIIYPSIFTPPDVDESIPDILKKDFQEASMIRTLSFNASAALSRRCLQNILIQKAGVNPKDRLYNQIEFIITNKLLPADLLDILHEVREIGNFAAHPKFDCQGVIIDTTQEEADFNLEVINQLFDYYFIREKKIKAIKKSIKAKKSSTVN